MMEYTILQNGVTQAVVTLPDGVKPAGRYIEGAHPIGRVWNGSEFVDPPAYATAAQARAAMVVWIDGLTAQVMSQYPQAVQARWPIEEAAARAVIAGTDTQEQTDLVTLEGAAKGRTPTEHAEAIIANADRFKRIANEINKLFLATDKALTDATDPEQYEGILQAAIAQAAPLAQAYGLEVGQ